MSLTGGKRKLNKSLKAWVAFVKKVQKEEKLSYKDAIHRAKKRKDKGEKWMTGGNMNDEMDVTSPKEDEMEDEMDVTSPKEDEMEDEMEVTEGGGKRRRRTMRKSRGRGRGKTARRSRGRGRASRRH